MEDAVFNSLMDFGVSLLECGAEVSRVEDSLKRTGAAHGYSKMQVFVITSCIIVTLTGPDGETKTQIRRILTPPSTNFALLEELNKLSRHYCECPSEDFSRLLEGIHVPHSRGGIRLGAALAAGFFALFFGGSFYDALAAGGVGILLTLLSGHIYSISSNQLIYHLLCSFLSGLCIGLLTRLFPFLHGDMILIGEIMLLIPGIAMTNSVRDLLTGNTISGLLRLIETSTWALALADGFMLSMWMTGMAG